MNLFKDGAFIADPFRVWAEGDDLALDPLHPYSAEAVPREPRGDPEQSASDGSAGVAPATKSRKWLPTSAASRPSPSTSPPSETKPRRFERCASSPSAANHQGEIRAVSGVLMDQVPLMRRCGISAFVVHSSGHAQGARDRPASPRLIFSISQCSVTEVPVGTRPFLRRAAETEKNETSTNLE